MAVEIQKLLNKSNSIMGTGRRNYFFMHVLSRHFCELKAMADRRAIKDEQSVSKLDNTNSSNVLPTKRFVVLKLCDKYV